MWTALGMPILAVMLLVVETGLLTLPDQQDVVTVANAGIGSADGECLPALMTLTITGLSMEAHGLVTIMKT
jgi:hypothetical protein